MLLMHREWRKEQERILNKHEGEEEERRRKGGRGRDAGKVFSELFILSMYEQSKHRCI